MLCWHFLWRIDCWWALNRCFKVVAMRLMYSFWSLFVWMVALYTIDHVRHAPSSAALIFYAEVAGFFAYGVVLRCWLSFPHNCGVVLLDNSGHMLACSCSLFLGCLGLIYQLVTCRRLPSLWLSTVVLLRVPKNGTIKTLWPLLHPINIPIPSPVTYTSRIVEKVESLIRHMRWRALFFMKKDQANDQHENQCDQYDQCNQPDTSDYFRFKSRK